MKSVPPKTAPAQGTLGVLVPGIGAVSTTLMAGVDLVRQGKGKPFGSLTQIGRVRLGKRTEGKEPLIRELVDLAGLDQIVFGGWDPVPDDALTAARKAAVLPEDMLNACAETLSAIQPMPAVFDKAYVPNIDDTNVKTGASKRALADQLVADIERFRADKGCDRLVVIWCGSTERAQELGPVHQSLESFERGLAESDPAISPSMMYAWAALQSGVPYINGAPHHAADIPALREFARQKQIPIAGNDFKTGQTLMKTIIAPGLKARMLGVSGWFSTNILGNRDGQVLEDPGAFRSKEVSKLGVLERILQPDLYPDLYGDLYHAVRINYYPPRGDAKEGWDNLDIFGWLGMPMQIKIDFLCRDSILAAPVALDLVLFMDLAQRSGMFGIQEWLSFYFKSPITLPELYPEHDLFKQRKKLYNTLRFLAGEELITHLGLDYYESAESEAR
jgi:Myo-inositol-1-phosphate synthase